MIVVLDRLNAVWKWAVGAVARRLIVECLSILKRVRIGKHMNIAVLRAEGSDGSLEVLRQALGLRLDAKWKKGELRRRGSVHERAGFSACVADVSEPALLISEIRQFLTKCRASNIGFSSAELTTQLDIGLTVGNVEQFTASVTFKADDLRLFSELGLELSVSAYPESDEGT